MPWTYLPTLTNSHLRLENVYFLATLMDKRLLRCMTLIDIKSLSAEMWALRNIFSLSTHKPLTHPSHPSSFTPHSTGADLYLPIVDHDTPTSPIHTPTRNVPLPQSPLEPQLQSNIPRRTTRPHKPPQWLQDYACSIKTQNHTLYPLFKDKDFQDY